MVDYPGEASLKQMYRTFNRAALEAMHNLRDHVESLTSAMVGFFLASRKRFTSDIQEHYIYSPHSEDEKRWTDEQIDPMAIAHFLSLNQHKALARPILFFNLDSELKDYISLDRDELHNRLKIQGHLLFIGGSGSGKITLS
ncbi:hypothetical protein PCANC_06461 [Puccinia coronata f. sp. avenae]|uniref:Dynein 2 heavy chain 1 cytoplasmic ATPase lid domain-containing protein n=1 Tax=Puccinia coronata f. sp. avenae TaxID=200324 RepID=A0A2N5UAB1_9BASI|nr:hypothetical protein PCANC_08282 [Puccinia coronata f. sp. avenae]PLW19459.1 hypothetical protein PCASD_16568 [Puccinia coronata f. sp. avenae]PLW34648.1 hypothetical protein PCASD_11993 [Puccinia coronata f. sp. avenae]PLW54163.1 hypothetical protein PCANC_06461 [Puccinia coronata f. sp. avenae]